MIAAVLMIAVSAATPVKLASPGLTAVNVDPKVVAFLADHFAQRLQIEGIDVVTQAELGALLGLERQKQLLGCADAQGSSCLAELAGGLGVDGVIVGSVAKVGGSLVLNLKIVAAKDARALAVISQKVPNEEVAVDYLSAQANVVAEQVRAAFPERAVIAAPAGRARFGPVPYIVGGVGIAALVTGIGLNFSARATARSVAESRPAAGEVDAVVNGGRSIETASWVVCGVGAAAIVAGVVMLVVGRPTEHAIAIVPVQGGAVVGFGGAFP